MIREIENRRSIRKYKQDKIDRNCCGWLCQGNHWKKSLSTDRKIGLNKIFNIMCLSFENKKILKN